MEFWNTKNLQRQITLKQQIEYTEGYIIGIGDDSEMKKNTRKINFEASSNSPWFQGFTKGIWKRKTNKKKSKHNSKHNYEHKSYEKKYEESSNEMEESSNEI